MIMFVSVHQKFILEKIDAFGVIDGRSEGMELDKESRLYYKQYDLEYEVKGNGDTVRKADRLKLGLFFNPARRTEGITNIDFEVERQRRTIGELLKSGNKLDDDTTTKRLYNWFTIEYDADSRILKSFTFNDKKVTRAKKAAGFFAYVTIALYKTPLEAMAAYGLRDNNKLL